MAVIDASDLLLGRLKGYVDVPECLDGQRIKVTLPDAKAMRTA